MSEQAHNGAYRNDAAVISTRRERYRRSQREARQGAHQRVDRPRPLEFDESGFPIPQTGPSFVQRVARLLNPS